jgi:antirestriction protein
MAEDNEHRIYVASLSDYNNGVLHGIWIDLDDATLDEVQEQIEEMLKDSPTTKKYGDIAEEWAIHDYENLDVYGENPDLQELIEQVEVRNAVGDEVYNGYTVNCYGDPTKEEIEESYIGEYESEEDYAEDFFRECYQIPEFLEMYIDWEAVARALFMDSMWSYQVAYNRIHVYRHC